MDDMLTSVLAVLPFIGVGFLAQIIDGSLGMAYGVSSNSLLLGLGIPPAVASASVHTAEVFTTAASGLSHFRFGNVDKTLFLRMILPGVAGGALGAYILVRVPSDVIKPIVAVYLLVMGLIIIWKVIQREEKPVRRTRLLPLCFAGGFLDAIGGGGWGPIVTSTLVARGTNPRSTIGSVNSAEFFVTFAESATFFLAFGLTYPYVVAGLLIGGVIAAPLGAYLTQRLPMGAIMTAVGLLIVILSVRTLYLTLA